MTEPTTPRWDVLQTLADILGPHVDIGCFVSELAAAGYRLAGPGECVVRVADVETAMYPADSYDGWISVEAPEVNGRIEAAIAAARTPAPEDSE